MAVTGLWPNRAPWRSLEHALWEQAAEQVEKEKDDRPKSRDLAVG
jgi:hypothetical protein